MSTLIRFPSDIYFSLTVIFRIWPLNPRFFSKCRKNLFDFSPFSYHWHLLRIRIPSAISSKISCKSCLCLLYDFIFSSLLSLELLSYFLNCGFFSFFFFCSDWEEATQNLSISYFKKSYFICWSRTFGVES